MERCPGLGTEGVLAWEQRETRDSGTSQLEGEARRRKREDSEGEWLFRRKARRDSEPREDATKTEPETTLLPTPRQQGTENRLAEAGAARGARPFLLLSEAAILQF